MGRSSNEVTRALVAIMCAACGDSNDDAAPLDPIVDIGADPDLEVPIDAQVDAPIAPPADAPIDAPLDAPPLPDVTLVHERMASSLRVTREAFASNACVLNECLARPGLRRLLRFDTMVANAGQVPVVLGAPQNNLSSWEYDSCHMHYHYVDFADYKLVDASGNTVAEGHKQAFCLRDDVLISGSGAAVFNCSVQGLSPGWADLYQSELDCQFVDITDVLPGSYMLRIELNSDHTINESNYNNNVGLFPVTID